MISYFDLIKIKLINMVVSAALLGTLVSTVQAEPLTPASTAEKTQYFQEKVQKMDRPKHSLFFLGLTKHIKPQPKTNEGSLDLIGYAYNTERKNWNFETGFTTFNDSYHERSYAIFTNISNDNWNTKHIQPTLNINCAYKGYTYAHEGKRWLCSPPVQFRIGKEKGLFAYVMPVPKLGNTTNGFVSVEAGYRY